MRLKIIAGNLVAVLVIGLIAFFVVRSSVEESLSTQLTADMRRGQRLFDRSFRLSSVEFLNNAVDRASTRELRVVFNAIGEQDQRQRAYNQCQAIAQWFRDPSRRGAPPDIVAVTDETGKCIARDTEINRCFGNQLFQEVPSLREAIGDGRARHDAWFKSDENKLMQTAIAPVRNESGTVIGALIVGYDLSNGVAQGESEVLARDVAFLTEATIYSSSLSGEMVSPLQAQLFGEQEAATRGALSGTPSTVWTTELGGDEYVAVTAPLPMTPSAEVAYVLLGNRTEALALTSVSYLVLGLMALLLLIVAIYGFIIGTQLLRPLEAIEEGVLGVINGRTDLRIDVESAEFGGLAYRINQLINVFTGVAEEDEDGRVASTASVRPPAMGSAEGDGWQGAEFRASMTSPSSSSGEGGARDPIDDPHVAAQLGAEPDEAYFGRVFQEYVAAKRAVGEDVSSIPQERFIKRLQANGEALAKKHGVRLVRFQVQTEGNQVALRPVLIR